MHDTAPDWNVVVTAYEHGYKRARKMLASFGRVQPTDYFNVLALRVADGREFLDRLKQAEDDDAALRAAIARAVPAARTFTFQTPDEFERHAREAVETFLPALAGRRFHVRMHRRGFKEKISSQREERFLDEFILASPAAAGARVTFDDPDVIVSIETIGQWAGISLWTREDLARYPFLRVD